MEKGKLDIDTIIRGWKNANGIRRVSEKGTSYVIIKADLENLEILADTLISYGLTFEELYKPEMAIKIANICWREDKITKMSSSEINKAKFALSKDWSELISHPKYSGVNISGKGEIARNLEEKSKGFKEPKAPSTEEEMEKAAMLSEIIKNSDIEDSCEEDTEFLEFMKLPIPSGDTK